MNSNIWPLTRKWLRRHWVFAPVIVATLAFLVSLQLRAPSATELDIHTLNAAGQKLQLQAGFELERRFTGRVAARQHADIGFELGGKVAQLLVNDGDKVEAGQLLARLDTEILAIERQQMLAQIADTKARQSLNQANIARHTALQASGFASQQRLDELQTEEKTLIAAGNALNANLANIDSRLRKASLLAPFAGNVTRRFADQGVVVGAGSPLLRLQQEGAMEVQVGVPVSFAVNLTQGQSLPIELRNQRYAAVVITVGADVNLRSNTVNVRLALAAQRSVFNGDIVQLVIDERQAVPGYWVDAAAVSGGVRGLWTVYAMVPQGEGLFRIEARDIEIVHAEEQRMYVRGALKDGEYVVASGVHRFVPGQLVSLTEQSDVGAGLLVDKHNGAL